MKKIKFSILALAIAAVSFTSCDNEITPDTIAAPVITFTEGDASILTGEAVSVSGSIFAEGELDQVIIKKNVDGTITTLSDDNSFDVKTSHDFVFDFTDVTESFIVTVEATDKEGETRLNTATITVTVPETVVKLTDLKIFCAVSDQFGGEIFASLTPDFGTYTYATADGNADITAMIDVMYYNGNYTKAGEEPRLVSPHAAPSIVNSGEILPNAKTTYFKVLETTELALFSDWASVNDDTDISSITGVTDVNTLTVAVDDVVAFELADGKKGIFKVKSWTAGWGATDYILLDVIVQKDAPVVK